MANDESTSLLNHLNEKYPTQLEKFTECCFGVVVKDRSELLQAILLDDHSPPPTWCQRLLCDCGARKRTLSGIEDIPEISNLAGLLLQNGDAMVHSTNGTVFTLKYADFDKETRIGELEVYGGYGGKQHTGQWSALNNKTWLALLTLGRCCNYSYRFSFSEDWRKADIDIRANCCCATCLPPCSKAWFNIPKSVAAFEMIQAKKSINGSHWIRNSSSGGGPMKFAYDLQAVYKPDGTPTEFVENFNKVAPEKMLLSR